MKFFPAFSSLIIISFFALPAIASTKNTTQQGTGRPQAGWSTVVRGGAVYQFDTDLDEGGGYNSGRYNVEVGQSYAWTRRDTVTLTLSYSLESYDFSDGQSDGIAFGTPWENIHTFSLSTPLRKGIGDGWTAFLIPSIRSTGESGAEFSETITGGGFTGISYRFSDRLTIGPGIGVFSQLEESASIFPVLIVNWKITDKISLETGRGLAATLGPGLTLSYKATPKLRLGIGGRYEKLRFRLDKDGTVAGGIGEDSSFPLFANCTYSINRKTSISLVGGMETGGELKIENSKGHKIIEESSDPGVFTGITFSGRF
ncbi:MAG: hypothetical protein ACI8ZB_004632 [Desulforhopalus sp.]|jgi:hypothetical protein